jgi:DNA-binding NarL/FixJ family response regulator
MIANNSLPTVAILDHRLLVRRGLAGVIDDIGGYKVTIQANSPAELFAKLHELRRSGERLPNVIILDILMPHEDGLAVLSRLAQEFPDCAPFVITDSSDLVNMRLAFDHGARGYTLREVSPCTMADALEALTENHHFVGPLMVGHTIRAFVAEHRQPVDTLTEREQDVLRLVALRLSNQEIAHRLSISESTVKTHLHHASEKLGARTRREAASLAMQVGVVLEPHLASAPRPSTTTR